MASLTNPTQEALASAAKLFSKDPAGALDLYLQALGTAEPTDVHRILNNVTLCLTKTDRKDDALQGENR